MKVEYKCLMKKKKKKNVVPKLRQEVKVKLNIVTSDDIKIFYTEKIFTLRNSRISLLGI